jgi:hypothetical protein
MNNGLTADFTVEQAFRERTKVTKASLRLKGRCL